MNKSEYRNNFSLDFKKLLKNKFPEILDNDQKENKLRNMLQKMKRNKIIEVIDNRKWKLV